MRNTVLEDQIQADLFKATNQFKRFILDYEIFPVFFLLKRLNSAFDQIIAFKGAKSDLEIYRELYKGVISNQPSLLEAFSVFEDIFSTHIYVHWPSFFKKFPIESLPQEEFEVYFEQSLVLSRQKDAYSDYSTPKEIAEFITSVYNVEQNAKVYNPFGGYASLANYFPNKINYVGNELNKKAWALGILNLAAHNRLKNSDFICSDYFYDENKNNSFDFVISSLPFGLKSPGIYYRIPNEVDGFTIYHALRQIAPNGKGVFLTSTGFLSNSTGDAKDLRKDLLERGVLEYVVLLPPKLFSNTSIPTVVLFLNTKLAKKGGTTFVDGSDFLLSSTKKDKKLDSESLLKLISDESSSENKRWVPNKEIIEQDYNFQVRRYLLDDEFLTSEHKVVTLGEISVERERERSIEPGSLGKFIRIRDLKDEIIENSINLNEIEIKEIPTTAYAIKHSSLLLALRFKTLKPSLLVMDNETSKVFVSSDIFSLHVNQDLVDISYLISELKSDFVLKQLKGYQYGVTIPTIRRQDVLNLRIRLPEKETQRQLFREIIEASYREKGDALRQLKKQHDLSGDTFLEISSLKHSLGKPLLNISSGLLTMKSYISQLHEPSLQTELASIVNIMEKNMRFASNILERNENELYLDSFKLDDLPIIEFIENYLLGINESSFATKFSISEEITQFFSNNVLINTNYDLLLILLNNILDNVGRHAFNQYHHDDNLLVITAHFEVRSNTPKLILNFMNNGVPFPDNFDKDKFVRKHIKAGINGNTGIGGYDIQRIISYMNGDFDLKLNYESQFPTIYEIAFPIVNVKIEDHVDL